MPDGCGTTSKRIALSTYEKEKLHSITASMELNYILLTRKYGERMLPFNDLERYERFWGEQSHFKDTFYSIKSDLSAKNLVPIFPQHIINRLTMNSIA